MVGYPSSAQWLGIVNIDGIQNRDHSPITVPRGLVTTTVICIESWCLYLQMIRIDTTRVIAEVPCLIVRELDTVYQLKHQSMR